MRGKKAAIDISSCFSLFIKRIRPTRKQLEEADRETATLKKRLTKYIAADQRYHLEKIFRAGSSVKHTDLVRRGEGTFDVDLGLYFRSQGYPEEDLNRLLPYIQGLLCKLYPEKVQDIQKRKNAVRICFRTSKLAVDIVPIVRDPSPKKRKNSGYIPREDGPRRTSITAHIHFTHVRTARSKRVPGPVKYNHLVRLMKWWNRRLPDGLPQSSYFCELITAVALEKGGVTNEWQSSLAQIFGFLSQHAFKQPIVFGGNYDPRAIKSNDLVVVLDAVNADNNITDKWTKEMKQGYLAAIRKTYKQIKQAQRYEQAGRQAEALDIWCQIFGEEFRPSNISNADKS
jgi:hypothetical protein